ncbi:MAG: nickel pincer cofactor biosynthesis protein LarC [Christensenellaceae bacterium]|jgi:uncharacterized protein (TIGR00299 family) protein
MRTLYLECNMGAAGDMLMAAFLELLPAEKQTAFLEKMNHLGLPGVTVSSTPATKCGIVGTHMDIRIHGKAEHSHDVHDHSHTHDHEHSHEHPHTHDHDHDHSHHHDHTRGDDHAHSHDHSHTHDHVHHGHDHSHDGGHSHSALDDILHTIGHLPVSDAVKENAGAVYALIAEAESHSHGVPISQIHFHEVGTMDAVADIVGVCLLIELLAPMQILASPVHVGRGQVKCAHGVLPVPAPATAYILREVPIYGGRIKGELTTPTGAALLKHFVSSFGNMPIMQVEKVGYGMGTKDFEDANCVRVYLGETASGENEIISLSCNLDDISGEAIGYATELLLKEGALDVFTTAIQMKKNRPGVMLSCLAKKEDAEKFAKLMLLHTSTLGVRQEIMARYTLSRSEKTIDTPYGPVRIKEVSGYGVKRTKPEYEDVAKIAAEKGLPFLEVFESILKGLHE